MPTTHAELELEAEGDDTAGASCAAHPTTPASSSMAAMSGAPKRRQNWVCSGGASRSATSCESKIPAQEWPRNHARRSGDAIAIDRPGQLCGSGGRALRRRWVASGGRAVPPGWISVPGVAMGECSIVVPCPPCACVSWDLGDGSFEGSIFGVLDSVAPSLQHTVR